MDEGLTVNQVLFGAVVVRFHPSPPFYGGAEYSVVCATVNSGKPIPTDL